MTYEIGQKVETPLGVGVLYTTQTINGFVKYKVEFEKSTLNFLASFVEEELKPYKTPHEKLLDMGFEFAVDVDWANMDFSHKFSKDDQRITIYLYDKTVTTYEVCKEAIAVLTEYLEWLEEEK